MNIRQKTLEKWREAMRRGEVLICGICQHPISPSGDLKLGHLTVDHIVPLSLGGKNTRSNFQPAHHRCNSYKSNNPDYVFSEKHLKHITEAFGQEET